MGRTSKIFLTIIIILLIGAVGGLGYYCYTLNQKLEKNIKQNTEQEKDNNEVKKDNTTKLDLFNTEKTLKDMCGNTTELCNKEIGQFSIGDKIYTLNINYNMNTSTLSTNNYLQIDNKIIKIGPSTEDISVKLDKIVKITDDYLAIGTITDANGMGFAVYNIYIYDKYLNEIKQYATHYSENNLIVNNGTFSYTVCNTEELTEENDYDDSKQKLDKYKISINNGVINEKYINSSYEFCSTQT